MLRRPVPSFLASLALATATLATTACAAEPEDKQTADGAAPSRPSETDAAKAFTIAEQGSLDEPWAMAFIPGTQTLLVTQKAGSIVGWDTQTGRKFTVTGAPKVDYGGQGGLGDIAFDPAHAAEPQGPRPIYLSWAEAGQNDTRSAAVGKGTLTCAPGGDCAISGLQVIWRQAPKVTGQGHFSHRIAFSPDARHLFIASGDRQKMTPAQDLANTLGTIVRLTRDGQPAPGNPFAEKSGASPEIWSYGHRNILGLAFDGQGRLWDLEHVPAGGDELNLVEPGQNYGWPLVSNGDHYDGKPIPRHATGPQYAAPAVSWTPVIAPGNMIFYTGALFPDWKGQAIISGLMSEGLVRVTVDGNAPHEAARYRFGKRLRAVIEGPDGALWVAEDGKGARLLKVTPR